MKKEKSIWARVPGRGINMSSTTRVVPHKHKPLQRLKTKEILNRKDL